VSEVLTFTCTWCGKPFEADPDAFIEVGLTAAYADDPEIGEDEETITREELEAMNEFQLREIGLTPELRDKLLSAPVGEHIDTGAEAVCKSCRDTWDRSLGLEPTP
jgi:hypothetical protein